VFAQLPNSGPAIGNINYDCVSETIRASSHEDCRIYQFDMNGTIVSTYHHASKTVTLGPANEPNEPNGQFCPLGDRVWAVQSHYEKLYYSVWWEDSGRRNSEQDNEIWSVEIDPMTGEFIQNSATLEISIPSQLIGGAKYEYR